ncbi:hypothetical protein V8C42DRAFT_336677 [Trichoderma barbatum]
MAIPARYVEGYVLVSLSLFRAGHLDSENSERGIIISNVEGILQNPEHNISGYVGPKLCNEIQHILNRRSVEHAHTPVQDATANFSANGIYCCAKEGALDLAKKKYGGNFRCFIQIYCSPPPQQRKLSDGEIFQTVRRFIHESRFDIAQEWMDKLSAPKKHHLSLMLGRPAIISAMDKLLPFPGLWAFHLITPILFGTAYNIKILNGHLIHTLNKI